MSVKRRSEDAAQAQRGSKHEASGDLGAALLIESGAVLATSLDPPTTMRQVAQLTVPRLADICVIDLLDDQGLIKEVAVSCEDPTTVRGLEALRAEHPLAAAGNHPVANVIRTGEPLLLPAISPESLRSFAQGDSHEQFMLGHEYRSAIVAPLAARDRTLGTISVLRLGDARPYVHAELELVCELARRAALAIDNAHLYANMRDLEQRLEAILMVLAEAVTVVDRESRTVFANGAARKLLEADSEAELARAEPGSLMAKFEVRDERGNKLALEDMPGRKLLRGERAEPLLVQSIVKATGKTRWLVVRSSPVTDPRTGDVAYVVNVFEDITDVKRAADAEGLLAEASRILSSSLDYDETLKELVRLLVPPLAELAIVSVIDGNDRIVPVAMHHLDPAKLGIVKQLSIAHPLRRDDSGGVAEVLRSATTIHAAVDAEALRAFGDDPAERELLGELELRSVIIVPMSAGGRVLGTITLASCGSRRPLSSADVGLAEEIGRRAGITVENALLFTERSRIASALQQALLPEALPEIDGIELHALYTAAGELNEVGGDFYDVIEHRDGRWMLAIGDVCGKGPRAAAVTALARHTMRAAAMSGQSPQVIVVSVHEALTHQPPGLDMCTLGLALVDIQRPAAYVTVALAGHPQPLLIGADGFVRQVGKPGTLLGVLDPVRVHLEQIEMHAGDTLLLFTDGVIDAGAPQDQLGEAGLVEIVSRSADLPLPALLQRIESATTERGEGRVRDDIALLGMRLNR